MAYKVAFLPSLSKRLGTNMRSPSESHLHPKQQLKDQLGRGKTTSIWSTPAPTTPDLSPYVVRVCTPKRSVQITESIQQESL